MITAEQDRWGSIAQFAAEYETIAQEAQADRWHTLLAKSGLTTEQVESIFASDAYGALSAEFRSAEANRHDLDQLLPRLVSIRGFEDADDIASVLHSRVARATARPAGSGRTRKPPRFIVGLIPNADGFVPGEDVAIALVTGYTDATGDGLARTLIDTSEHPDVSEVVLIGCISGTMAMRLGDQPYATPGRWVVELTNATMVGLLALVAFTFILRGAGSVTAWITGSAQPSGGPASGVSVLLNPSDPATALRAPGLSPVIYWIITGLMLTLTGILETFGWLRIRRYTTTVEADRVAWPVSVTCHDINATASTKALLQARTVAPESPGVSEVRDSRLLLGIEEGERLGVGGGLDHGHRCPGSGKGLHGDPRRF